MRIQLDANSTKPLAQSRGDDAWLAERRNEALALRSEGKRKDAVEIWRQILASHYDNAEVAHELGIDLVELGQLDDAIGTFRRSLQYRPSSSVTKTKLGRALIAKGQHGDARVVFEDASRASPDDVDLLVGLGIALTGLGQHQGAIAPLQRATTLAPTNFEAAVKLGDALNGAGRVDDAIARYRKAIELKPDSHEAGHGLARALRTQKRHDEAVGVLRPLSETSKDAGLWGDLASSLLEIANPVGAVAAFQRSLELDPASAASYCNFALALMAVDRIPEGIEACNKALAIEPNSSTAHFNRACMYLALGDYERGWADYEYRFALKDGNRGIRTDIKATPWIGQDLTGKSILVLGEQGNGDYIQFARYVPVLKERGAASVTFFVPSRLTSLMSSASDEIKVVGALTHEDQTAYDFQVHSMSLPQIFARHGWTAPSTLYLKPEAERVAKWRERIGTKGFRVAVAWQGFAHGKMTDPRGYPVTALAPLADIPGVRLISMQMGTGIEQLEGSGISVETLGDDFDAGEQGFLDAAAVLSVVDLVVVCDTSLSHLAGAVGARTFLALNAAPEWRWQRGISTTHWYPTMTLFRQTTMGDWSDVFARIADAIRSLSIQPLAETTAQPQISSPEVKVSWGECVDKATILEIKRKRMTSPSALANVELELATLTTTLVALEDNKAVRELRTALLEVNSSLWDVEDRIREKEAAQDFEADFVSLARQVYHLNDKRAALKRQINDVTHSQIVEEKQYAAMG